MTNTFIKTPDMIVILIYETNAWHEYSSRALIGIATTEKKRDAIISIASSIGEYV